MTLSKQSLRVKIESEVDYIICYCYYYTSNLMEMHTTLQKSDKANAFSWDTHRDW